VDAVTTLVFIRHAETDKSGTFCGHSNPPINARGHQQTNDLIVTLSPPPFDLIYSSDLLRALETAKPLADTFGLPIKTNSNLREIFFGEWESLTWAEIEMRDSDYARRWLETFPALPAPGGETYASFEARILEVCSELLAQGRRTAVITHGGVMRVALHHLLGYNDQQAWELTRHYCSSFTYTATTQGQE
jgi:broad specificity phosphatase PhoE